MASLKDKTNAATNLTAEDKTAAMSNEQDEMTLVHDASRQYLDYHIAINEGAESTHAGQAAAHKH